MTDIDFAAFLVSRVCHDLVGPLGAVVNGLEVLEEEHDAALKADALQLVARSANQALAKLQFMRLAFGAAGSAGASLPLGEVKILIGGLFDGSRIRVEWSPAAVVWPKDWAKLVMNGALIGADCLPRGGVVQIETSNEGENCRFRVVASGSGARVAPETAQILSGIDDSLIDARGVQPALTGKLLALLGGRLRFVPSTDRVEIVVE